MAKGGTWLKMRKSMKKFSGGDDLSFSVVEYSKVCFDILQLLFPFCVTYYKGMH